MNLKTRPKVPSFLSGVSILTLSAVVVKIIGLLYRIPMLKLLGTEGMGYFNTAYELYAFFCMISTAGLPVAMSVLISTLEANGRHAETERVYRVAMGVFAVIGGVGTAVLWGLSKPFAGLLGNPGAAVCMRAVAPTLLLVCLSSAFRGYFQGHRNMLPTALSQVIEAGGKLFLGLAFAGYARGTGADLATTAAYAILGLTVGTGVSMIYLLIHKRISDCRESGIANELSKSAGMRTNSILRPLLVTAVPVTLSAGVISLTKCIDLGLILRRLQEVGYTTAEANALYGCYSTLAVPVFNIIPSLTTSVALSAVPALSAALQKGREGEEELRKTAASSLRLTMLVAIPALFGVSVFAEDILQLLFAGQPDAVASAAPWLSCLGLSIPAACLVTVTGAMLQAAGKANRPVFSMMAGVACKVILAYCLLGSEKWGMMGVAVSSLACDTVIVLVNLGFLVRYAPVMMPTFKDCLAIFGIPALLSVCAVGAVKLLRTLFGWQAVTPLYTLGTVACVVCLYGAGVLAVYGSSWREKCSSLSK